MDTRQQYSLSGLLHGLEIFYWETQGEQMAAPPPLLLAAEVLKLHGVLVHDEQSWSLWLVTSLVGRAGSWLVILVMWFPRVDLSD